MASLDLSDDCHYSKMGLELLLEEKKYATEQRVRPKENGHYFKPEKFLSC